MIEDDILREYGRQQTISGTAASLNLSASTVRKVLVQAGIVETPLTRHAGEMQEAGLSQKAVAGSLSVSTSWVGANTPYVRGSYKNEDKSANALRIAQWRERRAGGGVQSPNNQRGAVAIQDKDFYAIVSSVRGITTKQEFVLNWAKSDVWGGDPKEVPPERVEWLETLYDVLTMPPRDLLTISGRKSNHTAMHWGIPPKTAASWVRGAHPMPVPIRLLLAFEAGLFE